MRRGIAAVRRRVAGCNVPRPAVTQPREVCTTTASVGSGSALTPWLNGPAIEETFATVTENRRP